MMYYRQKILLSILETFDGRLSRTQLQKLAFLFTRFQENKTYDFVPYRFGCYSFQANHDLYLMAKRGILEEEKHDGYQYWHKKNDLSCAAQLKEKDKAILMRLYRQFKGYSQEGLIRYTYIHFPYYAINSSIAATYLNEDQLKAVAEQKPRFEEKKLFTIGYEGISLEAYLNKLLVEDVRVLCDVRKNSFSMKYGFSKSQLQHACEQVGIAFRHIPELGIESGKRKKLETINDYQALFQEYEETTLVANHNYLLELASLFWEYPRIAITCFEASHCLCHRGRVAVALQALPDWEIPVAHL